jgi:outer membrane lipopolysaccharide assembly protein LptE/RlpB
MKTCELPVATRGCDAQDLLTTRNSQLATQIAKRETRSAKLFFLPLLLLLCACGYHPAGRAARLPADLHSIAVPAFANQTNTYRVEQVLTQAVVHEFLARTKYRVMNQAEPDADATLRGTVTATSVAPVTYDTKTGRVSTSLVTISLSVTLVDRQGKVLYSNPGYSFREQYQVSLDPSSFFLEENPAVTRLAQDFARTLVSNILEAY